MKNYLLISLFLIFPVCLFAGKANLTGYIRNPVSDSIAVSFYENPLSFSEHIVVSKLNRQGQFTLNIEVPDRFTNCIISYGEEQADIVLSGNSMLTLKADGRDFVNTIIYYGKDSVQSTFITRRAIRQGLITTTSKSLKKLERMNDPGIVDAVRKDFQSELNDMRKVETQLSKAFTSFWEMQLRYNAYSFLVSYNSSAKEPDDFGKAFNRFDDSLIDYFAYQRYLYKLVNATMLGKIKDNDSINSLIFHTMPPASAAYASAWLIYQWLEYCPLHKIIPVLKTYKIRYPTSPYTAYLDTQHESMLRTSSGKDLLDFSFRTIDGDTMKLSDMKGKVVMLDFWASWCRPCINSLPRTKKIQERFAGKPFMYLFISLDQDLIRWQKSIEDHKIHGLHALAAQTLNELPIDKLYRVSGIPTTFLIDRNGKFVEQSQEGKEVEDIIEALLD